MPGDVRFNLGLARAGIENNKRTKTTPPALYETHTSAVTAREKILPCWDELGPERRTNDASVQAAIQP